MDSDTAELEYASDLVSSVHRSKKTKAREVGHIIAESSPDERKKTFFFFMCYSHEGVFVQVFGGLGQRGR
jgi:hypothetical protein